jgi:hypothetical protein
MPLTALSDEPQFVTLRGGTVVDVKVLSVLLDLESRGARFIPAPDGRFRVDPPGLLTPELVRFLRAHRDEALHIIEYVAPEV